ncbi:hypothetical protein ACHAXS_008257 [Conticribra weissflogii]
MRKGFHMSYTEFSARIWGRNLSHERIFRRRSSVMRSGEQN